MPIQWPGKIVMPMGGADAKDFAQRWEETFGTKPPRRDTSRDASVKALCTTCGEVLWLEGGQLTQFEHFTQQFHGVCPRCACSMIVVVAASDAQIAIEITRG